MIAQNCNYILLTMFSIFWSITSILAFDIPTIAIIKFFLSYKKITLNHALLKLSHKNDVNMSDDKILSL
jgi:hypothetical protein